MFHKYNSFTNSLSSSECASAYAPRTLGTKEATNNFFVVPQPKGREPGGSGPHGEGSLAGRQMSITHFLLKKVGLGGSSKALATQAASTAVHPVTATAQAVAATAQSVAHTVQSVAANAQAAAASATQAVASSVSSHVASSSHSASHAAQSHGHGHGHGHAAPWEGVNLWRTPYKGDTDTITQVKRSKGTLDRYVEDRTRRLQQLQLVALRNKTIPTWVMMPRDKAIFAVQGIIVAYVLYEVATSVYQHLKAKDRLKLLKLLYKDNVD